ncbi:tryptophanyl-tRNA synthetase [Thelephora ganbajun]|uniref:Tryptophanyl-tRNA synthetase n=1 Tax=Thelephora ganbajun TaxID=370292 RepID=A0ACB6ZMB0_THEGA|nr:tryptophanyl-tRNA synthetase [Thelephora ganbajun]
MFSRASRLNLASRTTRICARSPVNPNYSAVASKTRPKTILSGIQPTGIPHLGNYLGALANWVKLQNEASPEDRLLYSIVGWHALTLPQDPKTLRAARWEMLASLLAIGLDPKRSILFHQDHNPDHTELAWILNCLCPVGKLKRMTTWKSTQARLAASRNANDESEVDESLLNAGLFTYPILQAADILAYRATHVPVGEDQQQHLELSRDIAETFNRAFPKPKKIFPLPQRILTPSRRILSLRDPSSKMSKSSPDVQSRILLTDEFIQIQSKIRSAVTDSQPGVTFDPVNRPGVSNIINILATCTNEDPEKVAGLYASKGHAQLKSDTAEAVEALLQQPREEFRRLKEEKSYLDEIAKDGATRAKGISEVTMALVRLKTGLA